MIGGVSGSGWRAVAGRELRKIEQRGFLANNLGISNYSRVILEFNLNNVLLLLNVNLEF